MKRVLLWVLLVVCGAVCQAQAPPQPVVADWHFLSNNPAYSLDGSGNVAEVMWYFEWTVVETVPAAPSSDQYRAVLEELTGYQSTYVYDSETDTFILVEVPIWTPLFYGKWKDAYHPNGQASGKSECPLVTLTNPQPTVQVRVKFECFKVGEGIVEVPTGTVRQIPPPS